MTKKNEPKDNTTEISLTNWERSCLTQAIGAVPTATLNDVENLLDFKNAVKIRDGADLNDVANAPDESEKLRVNSDTLRYAWKKLQNVQGFPVAERTIKMREKINNLLDSED